MGTSTTHLQAAPRRFAISGEVSRSFSNPQALLAVALVAWLLAMLPVLHTIWNTWMTDPLRSIGMFFPVLSIALIARAWKQLGWERAGTWWGLAPLLLAVLAIWLRETHLVTLNLHADVDVNLVPEGPILVLALSAALLMLGGTRLWRASLFPLFLLLFVNPVPSAFNTLLDLPLQHASAGTARRFALLIGEHPDGEQLRLMFTPDFGMFIAPGCNGIRGAVTLGYIALIASYWRGLSIPIRLLAGLSGLAMGYLFNFLRLCLLVVYYKVGRSIPAIQPHGALIDYLIGGSLFLFASVCFGLFFFRPTSGQPEPQPEPRPDAVRSGNPWLSATLLLAFLVLGASNLYAVGRDAHQANLLGPHAATTLALPQTVGPYHLLTQWNEGEEYLWGRYTDGLSQNDVLLGLWLSEGYHDALLCHITRSEKITLGQPIAHAGSNYRTFAYDNGLTNVFAASRVCPGCADLSNPVRWFGPIQLVRHSAERYFQNPSETGVLITHEADPGDHSSTTNFDRLRTFVASLDENTLIAHSKN